MYILAILSFYHRHFLMCGEKRVFVFWALEKFFEKGGLEKNESLGDLGFIGLDPEKSCCVFQMERLERVNAFRS